MNFDPEDHGPCQKCGLSARISAGPQHNDYGGIDPCLPGFIPGVSAACCGHGVIARAYVQLGGNPNDSSQDIEHCIVLRGHLALAFFDIVRAALTHGPRGCTP